MASDLAAMLVCRAHGQPQARGATGPLILEVGPNSTIRCSSKESYSPDPPQVPPQPAAQQPQPPSQPQSQPQQELVPQVPQQPPPGRQRSHPSPGLGRRTANWSFRTGPQVGIVRDKILHARSGGVSGEVFDEIASVCSAAFETENAQRHADAAGLVCLALPKAALGAIRSPSVASAVAMLVSLLRSPNERCRRAALETCARDLDSIHLLRSVLRGIGGQDPSRHWQAAWNALLTLHLILSCCGKPSIEKLRNAGGLPLVLEVWKSGGHNADVAQECCAVTLLLSHGASRAAAAAGAAECALAAWHRFGQDNTRGSLTQGVAETTLLCLPHMNERPPALPRLAVESLRTLQGMGPAPAVMWLLKALARLATEPKMAPELNSQGVADLVLAVLADERWGQELNLRRLVAEAFAKPLAIANGHGSKAPMATVANVGSFDMNKERERSSNVALPSAIEALMSEAGSQDEHGCQPTLNGRECAQALHRRLVAWRSRLGSSSGSKDASGHEVPALRFDGDFECGSLGAVARIGPREYEITLVSDTSGVAIGDYVQWFCFRVQDMEAGEPYTFHLGNLIKPGSLFEEGCQPVMFSRKRRDTIGLGWTREGSDVAYYPYHDLGRRHCVSFDLRFPFDHDEVFLAHAPPYSFSDHLEHISQWPDIPRRRLLPSCAGRDVTALKIGDPDAPQTACIVARSHPGETHASWVMRGVLDFLLGGSPDAAKCFKGLRWILIPMLNPDGVASGKTRTNLDGIDLNRHHHDDAAPETRGLRALLQEEVKAGEPLVFVDIHSHSRRRGVFAIANGAEGDPLVLSIASHSSLIDAAGTARSEIKSKDEGVGRVAAHRLGFRYSITLESSLCARHAAAGNQHLSLHDLLEVGHAVCKGVAEITNSGDEEAGEEETADVEAEASAPSATATLPTQETPEATETTTKAATAAAAAAATRATGASTAAAAGVSSTAAAPAEVPFPDDLGELDSANELDIDDD